MIKDLTHDLQSEHKVVKQQIKTIEYYVQVLYLTKINIFLTQQTQQKKTHANTLKKITKKGIGEYQN